MPNLLRLKLFTAPQTEMFNDPSPSELFEHLRDQGPDREKRYREKLALALGIIGWIIIGGSLNTVIFAALPLQIASPNWQLALIASLIDTSTTILFGLALIAISMLVNTSVVISKDALSLASIFAGYMALVLALAIPLQFYIGNKVLKGQAIQAAMNVSKLGEFYKSINAATSEAELRSYVNSLPNSPALPAKFDAPFPVIKARALENLTAQINATKTSAEIVASQSLQTFLKEAVRNTAQAILMVAGFSAIATLSKKGPNPITRFFAMLLDL